MNHVVVAETQTVEQLDPARATRPPTALYDLHRQVRPQLDRLRALAIGIDSLSLVELRQALWETLQFLRHGVRGLAAAEEEALVPMVEWLMGMPRALRTLSADHTSLQRLADELRDLAVAVDDAPPTVEQRADISRLFRALHALLKVHMSRVEEILLPLAEARLDATSAKSLARRMREAAQHASTSG